MIAPYKGPYPCPTCGQGEPEPLDEMQRLGQEFDVDRTLQIYPSTPSEPTEPAPCRDPGMDTWERDNLLNEISRLKAELDRLGDEREEARQRWQETLGRCLDARARIEDELAEAAAQREKDAGVIKELVEAGDLCVKAWDVDGDPDQYTFERGVLQMRGALARAKDAGHGA